MITFTAQNLPVIFLSLSFLEFVLELNLFVHLYSAIPICGVVSQIIL